MSLRRGKIAKIVSALIIALMLLSSTGLLLETSIERKEGTGSSFTEPIILTLARHDPIRINSDADFDAAHGVTGGSGSVTDPYRIENLEIDAKRGGAGIYIGNTSSYFIVRNCSIYNTSEYEWPYYRGAGIILYNTHNGLIFNNTLSDNRWAGILIYKGSDNTVSNNLLENNNIGVYLDSWTNIVSNNTFINNTDGIYVLSAFHNRISQNNISYCSNNGIEMLGAAYCTVSENKISNSLVGISLSLSTDITVSKNSLFSCGVSIDGDEMDMWDSHDIDSQNTIDGKPIYYLKDSKTPQSIPMDAGQVILANCEEIKIEGLNLSNASIGIQIAFSQFCEISENTVSNNSIAGVYVYKSHSITIYDNVLSNNMEVAVDIESCVSNRLFNNTFVHGGIFLNGDSIEHWNTHEIDSSNTVNGKPVYYLKNRMDGIVESGAGEVILANCTNITIKHQKLVEGDVGIDMAYSDECTICENNISLNNHIGIHADTCNNNTIFNNTFAINKHYGIYLFHSKNNRIYHNDFFGNAHQARDDSINMWNCSYPIGGNYWSDYDAPDEYSGDSYRVAGSDGIRDEPYISVGIIDYYPLASPYRSKPNIMIYSPPAHSLFNISNVSMEWFGKAIGSEITHYEVRIDNKNWTDIGKEMSYRFHNLSDGEHRAYVKAVDIKGHISVDLRKIIIDSTPPELVIIAPSNSSTIKNNSINIIWEGNDFISGIDHYEIKVNSEPWENIGTNASYDFVATREGEYTIKIKAIDKAGNENESSIVFFIPMAKLVGKILDEYGNPLDGATITIDNEINTMTDSNGSFSVDVPAGNHTLIISKDGYNPIKININIVPGKYFNISEITLSQSSEILPMTLIGVVIVVGIIAYILLFSNRHLRV